MLVPFVGLEMGGGRHGPSFGWAVAVLYPVHLAMMLTFEPPDVSSDRASGNRVLAVRLGRPWTDRTVLGLLFVAWVVLIGGIGSGDLPPETAWVFATALFPGAFLVAAFRDDRPDLLTFAAVGIFVVAAVDLALTASVVVSK